MKKKKLFIRIFSVFFLIFFIFAYLLFYFIPTVEKINHYKRELKDRKLKIENLLDDETVLSFSDKRERSIFKEADEALKSEIPEIKNKEDYIKLFTWVFNYLKKRGRTEGAFNLEMTFDFKKLELNGITPLTDKKNIERLLDVAFSKLAAPSPSALLKGLNHQGVFFRFSGELRNALNFINHIPWGDNYLRLDNITVSPGEVTPHYLVLLNVYFIDLRSKDAIVSVHSTQRKEFGMKHAGKEEGELVIDFNSPLLLRRVYENPMGIYPKRELLPIYETKLNFVVDY